MIEFCYSDRIRRLFERVELNAGGVRGMMVSSPFIDHEGLDLLCRARNAAVRGRFPLRVITRPETMPMVRTRLAAPVAAVTNLHAKVYAILGANPFEHELIVTSANLTHAGLDRNVEVGLRLTGSRPDLASLIERVAHWIRVRVDNSRLLTMSRSQ